jgi:tetratricopeptide (TPR) repeat protein
MAYWGIALAHGSNINIEIDPAGERAAYDAITRAKQLDRRASDGERAYIAALASRYSNASHPNLRALALAYASAAARLASRYPDDPDAATIYAESMMELQPWQWYTPAGLPTGYTSAVVATLEGVLTREPRHIGANHLYIHATEASLHPQRALVSAAQLRSMAFEPAAAHLVHMPAHIYMRTGDFTAATEVNEHASMHDLAYRRDVTEPDMEGAAFWKQEFDPLYHDHNLTMLVAGYAEEGAWHSAKRVSTALEADDTYVPAYFAYLRCARWADILALQSPPASTAEPMRTAVWHFARGMALAKSGDASDAVAELDATKMAQTSLHIDALPGLYNSSVDILSIATDVLSATIAGARGDHVSQIGLLRKAVLVQDNLLYIEPPDWYFPVRQGLGAALYANGDYNNAVSVFREDLQRNQRNPRALYGLYKTLSASGSAADAAWVKSQFDAVWRSADLTLSMSDL